MPLSIKQRAVLKGMIVGILFTIAIVTLGVSINPFDYKDTISTIDKLSVAVVSGVIPIIFLGISIARMARHRFYTPDDIDGVVSSDTERAIELQTLLQNTLEQALLAIVVYCAWSIVMPAIWLSVVPIAAIFFGIGRIMFFAGYNSGAPSRSIGFTLTFYPSVVMLLCILGRICWQLIS